MTRRLIFLSLIFLILLPLGLSGCASSGDHASTTDLKMAPMANMPAEVKMASVTVQDAYRFNVANPEIMKEIPCYCGCGDMGHASNYACYVQDDSNGQITFDGHALGCSICVDITQDTMRMLKEGKSVTEIKQVIDDTYSKFGPSNIP
ncbi:MAG: hypothetical protein GX491_01575 [Chloroflexi bacterium]|nr:hypothetical protein [Chloroflexota bacterium]